MDIDEINKILRSFGLKENAYGGMNGSMRGVKFTICSHPSKGLCFIGHSYNGRELSEFEEYVDEKVVTKDFLAYKIQDICERYGIKK